MREMSSLMSDTEAKKTETECELKVAVNKIWELREIITDLEQQLQAKADREEEMRRQIIQMEELITEQSRNQQELTLELDSLKMGSDSSQINEHIGHLQVFCHLYIQFTIISFASILRINFFSFTGRAKETSVEHGTL